MELIRGQVLQDFPVRNKEGEIVRVKEALAEVGALSALVMDPRLPSNENVVSHQFGGFITKVKSAKSNEAGVSAGHGSLTSLAIASQ